MDPVVEKLMQGFETMGIGIGVVFVVLAVFYFVIRLMMKIWPSKD